MNHDAPPRSPTPELAAVILTLNEERHISDCIASLGWADRIVVVDSYSSDRTIRLAQEAGAEISRAHFKNYADQRNVALERVQSDWIFFVDADERGSPALGREIRATIANCEEVGWYVPRHNYIFGRLTRGAGWYPDFQLRLFRHGRVHYERPVHEIARVEGEVGRLKHPLVHYNYRDRKQFQRKQRAYSEYDASILFAAGVRPRPYSYFTMPVRHFWWRFVTLKGYIDGLHGLRLSLYMAYYEWVKYRRLGRLWRQSGD